MSVCETHSLPVSLHPSLLLTPHHLPPHSQTKWPDGLQSYMLIHTTQTHGLQPSDTPTGRRDCGLLKPPAVIRRTVSTCPHAKALLLHDSTTHPESSPQPQQTVCVSLCVYVCVLLSCFRLLAKMRFCVRCFC